MERVSGTKGMRVYLTKEGPMNTANMITGFRFALSLGLIFYLIPNNYIRIGLAVFIVSAALDMLDGWWAREYNQETEFGALADTFADKILICGILAVMHYSDPAGPVTLPIVLIVSARETMIMIVRQFIAPFAPDTFGKIKMWFQCITVGALFLHIGFGIISKDQAHILAVLMAGITVGSGFTYAYKLYSIVREKED